MLLLHSFIFRSVELFTYALLIPSHADHPIHEKQALEYLTDDFSSTQNEEYFLEEPLHWTFVKISPFKSSQKESQDMSFHIKSGLKGLTMRAGVDF